MINWIILLFIKLVELTADIKRKAFNQSLTGLPYLCYDWASHLLSRHSFCASNDRNVQATIRLDLLPVPMGIVLNWIA